MDFIGLFFVGSTLSLTVAHLIEALIDCRPNHEDMGQDFNAQPWGPRASAALKRIRLDEDTATAAAASSGSQAVRDNGRPISANRGTRATIMPMRLTTRVRAICRHQPLNPCV
jgi:hypothetical protein